VKQGGGGGERKEERKEGRKEGKKGGKEDRREGGRKKEKERKTERERQREKEEEGGGGTRMLVASRKAIFRKKTSPCQVSEKRPLQSAIYGTLVTLIKAA
jgi:hypothetical protein